MSRVKKLKSLSKIGTGIRNEKKVYNIYSSAGRTVLTTLNWKMITVFLMIIATESVLR